MDFPSEKKYPVILADPPWAYRPLPSKKMWGSAHTFYPTMTADEIAALPVASAAAKDCMLFMWTTWPMLADGTALKVMAGWGFRCVTCAFVWVKTYKGGAPYCGFGFYTRSGSEVCLLGTRGHPKRRAERGPAGGAAVRQMMFNGNPMPVPVEYEADDMEGHLVAPVTSHSRKPTEQYARIEQLCAGPYLELFARGAGAPGWAVWGNEAVTV